MGFNTSMIILNDALHHIGDDVQFGKKVYDAALMVGRRGKQDISSGNHCNAASVIESHHADGIHLIAIGGNCGQDLGHVGNWTAKEEDMLRAFADRLGYRLVKKTGFKRMVGRRVVGP